MAAERVAFQGLPARICWLGYGERDQAGLRFNEMVAHGRLKAPVVIGRDHLDCGSAASPYRETQQMLDGSDAIADWPLRDALLNTASGASWVSIHHGGGVGSAVPSTPGRSAWPMNGAGRPKIGPGAHERPRDRHHPPRGCRLRAGVPGGRGTKAWPSPCDLAQSSWPSRSWPSRFWPHRSWPHPIWPHRIRPDPIWPSGAPRAGGPVSGRGPRSNPPPGHYRRSGGSRRPCRRERWISGLKRSSPSLPRAVWSRNWPPARPRRTAFRPAFAPSPPATSRPNCGPSSRPASSVRTPPVSANRWRPSCPGAHAASLAHPGFRIYRPAPLSPFNWPRRSTPG